MYWKLGVWGEVIMNSDVEKIDQALRAEADELLWRKGLHPLLKKYGRVHLTGSYSLKLMAWRDLDIYLVAEEISLPDFFHLGSQIAELVTPARMQFRNERVGRTEGLPEGLYWGVYLGNEREGKWKIDIWTVNEEQFITRDEFFKGVESRLTAESRVKILEIKSGCWRKSGYRRWFTSRDIYVAVLDEGVENLAAFGQYLERVKGCRLDDA
jgi:hypothetical protein